MISKANSRHCIRGIQNSSEINNWHSNWLTFLWIASCRYWSWEFLAVSCELINKWHGVLLLLMGSGIDSVLLWDLQFNSGSERLNREVLLGKDTIRWFVIAVRGEDRPYKTRFLSWQREGIEPRPRRTETLPTICRSALSIRD